MQNDIFLSSAHRSTLLRRWVVKGKPKIVLATGFHDGKTQPAETIVNLGAFLRCATDKSRVLTVLGFFGFSGWDKETQDEWMKEFIQAVPPGKLKLKPILVQNKSLYEKEEWFIMGNINNEEAKVVLEADLMTKEALLERIKKGNDRLMAHYAEIMQERDTDRWTELIDNFLKVVGRLNLLCHVLECKGYKDCLYIENGEKKRSCLFQDKSSIVCWACPSVIKWWERELFGTKDLPVYRTGRGEEVIKFLKEAGRWKEAVGKESA